AVPTRERVLPADLMIDLELVVIDPLLIVAVGEEIIIALIRIEDIDCWLRIQIEYLLRNWTDQVRRNRCVRERCSGHGIAHRPVIRAGGAPVAVTIVVSKTGKVAIAG